MYYVVMKGNWIDQYNACFHSETAARDLATNLKAANGENYHVIKLSTTWTTQTLDEAMKEEESK